MVFSFRSFNHISHLSNYCYTPSSFHSPSSDPLILQYKRWLSSLCNSFHSPVTSSPLALNIPPPFRPLLKQYKQCSLKLCGSI
jgi:hypothetical protein